MTVSREEISWCYRVILGREPESEDAIRAHMHIKDTPSLGRAMLSSDEFKTRFQRDLYSGQSKWVAVEVMDRFIQWIDLHDRFVSFGCFHNNWEPSESEYFKSKLDIGQTVLDIGANVGWFTLLAAKTLGNTGQIHSFEPRPETFKMLKRTIYHNRLQQTVTVWPLALSDEPGTINLCWEQNTDNPGGSYAMDVSKTPSGANATSVNCTTLDEVMSGTSPDLIKIDVEGAEPRVFRGAVKTISAKLPPILSELHPAQLKRVSDFTPSQYIGQMADFGYRCFLLENGRPTRRLKDFPSDRRRDLVSVVFE